MSIRLAASGLFLAAAIITPLAAYNPPTDTAGPLTVRIDGPEEITHTGAAVPMKVRLENAGPDALRGRLRVTVIDGWSVAPAAAVDFEVAAKGSREYAFSITAVPDSYSAHYPIHAFAEFTSGGVAMTAH